MLHTCLAIFNANILLNIQSIFSIESIPNDDDFFKSIYMKCELIGPIFQSRFPRLVLLRMVVSGISGVPKYNNDSASP